MTMFEDGIGNWITDSSGLGGFADPGDITGQYAARNFTFALMCANALGINNNNNYTNVGATVSVAKSAIENQLWGLQQTTSSASNTSMTSLGGIWTDFCTSAYSATSPYGPCNLNPLSDGIGSVGTWGLVAGASPMNNPKETEEDAPLVLLAYGKNIW
jgi:hypothetical protein